MNQQASQKCHNCRRRRLRCDRTVPACRKCIGLGEECLGYGKLFRWVDSVATRSKRAGQRASAEPATRGSGSVPGASFQAPSPSNPSISGSGASDVGSPPETSALTPPETSTALTPIAQPCFRPEAPTGFLPSTTTISSSPHSSSHLSPVLAGALSLRQLTDPVLQDHNSSTRYYIHYFAEFVARDLVVYDIPAHNPFRTAVQLCRPQGFVHHVVVALSAVHHVSLLRSRGLPIQDRLYDALLAKQIALTRVKNALTCLANGHDYNEALTAVIFLVNFGLVDSGRDVWKMHIIAAGRLMAFLQQAPTVTDPSILALTDYVMSDCLTYFILGSTLGSWEDTGADRVFSTVDIGSVLKRAEANTYHSIPSEVMMAILRSTQLAAEIQKCGGVPSQEQLDEATGLMRLLLAFDAQAWAQRISSASEIPLENMTCRAHMASAHRSAACAYLSLAIPGNFTGSEDYASGMYFHLQQVKESDMLFKGTVWPTFMLGAQTADPEKRAWVEGRLRAMWLSVCPWGYVKTALETLEAIWKFRDDLAASSPTGVRPATWNWLAELKALNVDCLIV